MIRLLTAWDYTLWMTIRLEAVREHPAAFGSTYEEEVANDRTNWNRHLENSHLFCFIEGERPVGIAGYFYVPLQKMKHRGKIFSAYVNGHYRGKGIMDLLLSAIEYHARDAGLEQLHLDVGTANTPAIRCYERNGFAIYGTEPRALKLGGEYIDEYLMVKHL